MLFLFLGINQFTHKLLHFSSTSRLFNSNSFHNNIFPKIPTTLRQPFGALHCLCHKTTPSYFAEPILSTLDSVELTMSSSSSSSSGKPMTDAEWAALEAHTRATTGGLGSSFQTFIDDLEKKCKAYEEVSSDTSSITRFNIADV